MSSSTLADQIQDDWKTAMKEKNVLRKEILSYIRAQIKNKAIDTKWELTDDDVIQVIKKEIKSRKETLESLDDESEEWQYQYAVIKLLQDYLPKPLGDEEMIAWIKRYRTESNEPISNAHRWAIQSGLRSQYWARVDWKRVNEIICQFIDGTIQ